MSANGGVWAVNVLIPKSTGVEPDNIVEQLEAVVGPASASGHSLIDRCTDASWYRLTEAEAAQLRATLDSETEDMVVPGLEICGPEYLGD